MTSTGAAAAATHAAASVDAGARHAGVALLEVLRDLEVEVFLGNMGSDAPSVIDAFARFADLGETRPRPIQVPHEMVAVSMAHGYYLASGKPPVVMVHSTVGTANAATAVINAARAQVPLVLLAGRTAASALGGAVPRTLEPHWAQEVSDQGGILRPWVKWDYELRSPGQLEDVLRRAFAVAMSEPRGPVYLVLPMDVMASPLAEPVRRPPPALPFAAAAAALPDPAAIERLAEMVAAARFPLLVTRNFGRRPEAVAALVALAESFALPVVEYQVAQHVNFPASHPHHLGYDPHPWFDEADLVIVLDSPVPWVPALREPAEHARVVHLAVDPLWTSYPEWTFRSDLAVAGDPLESVRLLTRMLRQRRGSRRQAIADRERRLRREHERLRRGWRDEAREAGQAEVPSAAWISACLRPHLDAETLVVQEYDLKIRLAGFEHAGGYIGFAPSGGLGFGVGAALGAKLAAPEKTVIAVVGDGTYLLGCPLAAHLVSAADDLPVLWIVVDNHGWGAVKEQVRQVHPQSWAVRGDRFPLTRFGHDVRYELAARACGGAGEAVSTSRALPEALGRALGVVRHQGRQALLRVECGEPSFAL